MSNEIITLYTLNILQLSLSIILNKVEKKGLKFKKMILTFIKKIVRDGVWYTVMNNS